MRVHRPNLALKPRLIRTLIPNNFASMARTVLKRTMLASPITSTRYVQRLMIVQFVEASSSLKAVMWPAKPGSKVDLSVSLPIHRRGLCLRTDSA